MILNGKHMVLDGHDFLLCLPGKELSLAPESSPDNLWSHIKSELNAAGTVESLGWFWCQGNGNPDSRHNQHEKYISRFKENAAAETYSSQTSEDDSDGIGWRPILIPLTPQEQFDPDVFGNIPNGTKAKMYTVVMNGKTVRADMDDPELYLVGSSISVTDQFYSNNTLVGWVICDGIAIADRNILGNISWRTLCDQGLFEDKVDITIAPLPQLIIYNALIQCPGEEGNDEYALYQPLSKP